MKTLMAIVAVVILGWYLPFWSHTTTENERSHIKHAVQYIEQFHGNNSRLPSYDEFLAWEKQEDLNGSQYEGLGFELYDNCFPLKAVLRFGVRSFHPYCLNYWTGDVWVTYWSPQSSIDTVIIDDSGGIALVVVVAGILMFLVAQRHRPQNKLERGDVGRQDD